MKDMPKKAPGSAVPPAKLEVYMIGRYYRMEGECLGKGNFARVELGCHTLLKKQVAVKIIDMSQVKEGYVRRNLEREARVLARLDHPNIVLLYETLKNRELYFIVTELAAGGDLCRYIKSQREGKLAEVETRRLARQLVSALHHMHYQGIVHRDLKMENIMMDAAKAEIKLVDFGLSNDWATDSPLKTHCGSPEYAAPELFEADRTYGPEIDVWSLGVILYAMVAGRLPFISSRDENVSTRDRRKRLLELISKGLVASHRRNITGTSSDYQNLVNRLLSPDPTQRYPVNDIVVHPWITAGGRSPLKLYKRTDPPLVDHTAVVHKMSDMLHLPIADVENSIKDSPFGPLGGIYNVMTHARRHQCPFTLQEPISRSPTPLSTPPLTSRSIKGTLPTSVRRASSSVTPKPSGSHTQKNKVTSSVPTIPDAAKKTLNDTSSSNKSGMSAATSTLNLLCSKSSKRDKLSETTSTHRCSNPNYKTSTDSRITDISTSSTYSSSLQAPRSSTPIEKKVQKKSFSTVNAKPSPAKVTTPNSKILTTPNSKITNNIKTDEFANRRCKTAPTTTRFPLIASHDSSRMSIPTPSNSKPQCSSPIGKSCCRPRRKQNTAMDQISPLMNTFDDRPQKGRETMRALRKYIGQSCLATSLPPSDADTVKSNSFIPRCNGNFEPVSAPQYQLWKQGQTPDTVNHPRPIRGRQATRVASPKTRVGGITPIKIKEDMATPSSESTLLEWPTSPVKCDNTSPPDEQKTDDPIRRLDMLLERAGFSVNTEGSHCQDKIWSSERKGSSRPKSYVFKTSHSRETVTPNETLTAVSFHSGRPNTKSKWTTPNQDSRRPATTGVRLVCSGHR